jgi:hypothetical protein
VSKRRAYITAGAIFLVSQLSLVIFLALYVTHEVNNAQATQCSVIALSTQPRPRPPVIPIDPEVEPQTPFGKALKEYTLEDEKYKKELEKFNIKAGTELRNYSRKIGCPEGDKTP